MQIRDRDGTESTTSSLSSPRFPCETASNRVCPDRHPHLYSIPIYNRSLISPDIPEFRISDPN
ncbi:hypothetical protein PGT21_016101 [Puccinia graminis f. sp. tritici]|uniref:Uncharacterized protein n=1 Tax=Puccinia graminis f. sp. tritici TaxID=56615 RepID=A0A5B0NXN4_PUCGR|nr:hypothetical protein PGT21_016101 [Puccinia graminis f. sp. tritici]